MSKIRTVIVGVGNCASALVQGVSYCQDLGSDAVGQSLPILGGYKTGDVEFVAAFDVDARKVGRPISEAIFAEPNCTGVFYKDVSGHQATVQRGPDLDGVSAFMRSQPAARSFETSSEQPLEKSDIVALLKASRAEVVIIFLPVGSSKAVEFYVECALEAGCAVVNGIPVFIASDPVWAKRFEKAGLPILGDDFKAQFGATVVHRTLANLAEIRGVKVNRTYQLNVGGNTDFLNMTDQDRLIQKRKSKTDAVQAALETRLEDTEIRIGPSDYVPWLNDQKVAYIRLEGQLFGGAKTSIELRLEVEDSPNAAAEALTAIRCARIALDRGLAGPINTACAFLFKHPPIQQDEVTAFDGLLDFADGNGEGN